MKRIEIMLACIAILAGAGRALAFKANAVRFGTFCISSQVNGGVTTCTFTKYGKITVFSIPQTYATVRPENMFCTVGLPCGLTRFTGE